MLDVIGIDMPCIDLNVNVKKFPKPNGGERIEKMTWQGGGKVASGMVAAARLGAKCAMTGAVGNDVNGRFCIKDFQYHGIDVSGMRIREGCTTSLSVVLSDAETGGRSIMSNPGNSPRYAPDEIDADAIRSAKYLFVAYITDTVKEAIRIAREAGVTVVIDADGYSEELMECIPLIDVFIASDFCYKKMYQSEDHEANCRDTMAKGPKIVIFTRGEKGCVGVSDQGFFNIPAFKVDVVDTVGAGDVYHGGFIAGLISGRTVEETARFASAVSAIKCTRIGGRAGIPTTAIVERFLKDGVIEGEELDQRVEYYTRGLEHV